MTLLTPPVTAITLAGDTIALGDAEWSVQVSHGRNDIGSTPEPSSAQVTLLQTGDTSITGTVGDELVIAARGVTRFTGTVTDIDIAHLPGDTPLTRVTLLAIGNLSRLVDFYAGADGYTAQDAQTRVETIMDTTGLSYDASNVDPDLDLLAHPAEEGTVLALLTALNESTGGTLADLPNGDILIESYTRRGYVSGSAPTPFALPADGVLWEPVWKQTLETIRNKVILGYGASDPQATVTVEDSTSQVRYKVRYVVMGTTLATLADATARAGNVIAAQSRATWSLQQVSIMVDLLDTDDRAAALALVSGSRVSLTDLPEPAPDTTYLGVVEGWGDSMTPAGHVLTLSLSDPRFSNAMLLWSGIPSTVEWSEITTARVWADLVTADDL